MPSNIGYQASSSDGLEFQDGLIPESVVNDMAFMTARLFGAPPMMRDEVDPLIKTQDGRYSIGRMAAQTIATNPTIVSISPGEPKFLPFGSPFIGAGVVQDAIAGVAGAVGRAALSSATSGFKGFASNHMFYTMKPAFNEYINTVNLLARIMSIYIGIGDEIVPLAGRKPFKEFDWAHYYDKEDPDQQNDSALNKNGAGGASDDDKDGKWSWKEYESLHGSTAANVFSYYGSDPDSPELWNSSYVHFYANANTSYDESVSTQTRQSAIQSQFEGVFNDTVKDVQFLFGGVGNSDGIIADIEDLFSNLSDSAGGIGALAKAATNYLKGGRLIFPEMIDATSYSKSISLGFKFTSPDGSPISIFLFCLLPLAHLMGLAFPRQIDNNMYTYPFLVSCYARGFINCDMGVVTSIRIARGGSDELSWTASGMPTEIEVSMEIQPLHSEMMVTSARHPFLFLQNYGLQEYIGVICGADMRGGPSLTQLDLIGTLFKNWVSDLIPNVLRGLQDMVLGSRLGILVSGIGKLISLP